MIYPNREGRDATLAASQGFHGADHSRAAGGVFSADATAASREFIEVHCDESCDTVGMQQER
jgi:hypothetical protein